MSKKLLKILVKVTTLNPKRLCIRSKKFTEAQRESQCLSQQNNGNDAKQQKICSINNALKLSNTLEAHIAQSNDCKIKVFQI